MYDEQLLVRQQAFYQDEASLIASNKEAMIDLEELLGELEENNISKDDIKAIKKYLLNKVTNETVDDDSPEDKSELEIDDFQLIHTLVTLYSAFASHSGRSRQMHQVRGRSGYLDAWAHR